MIWGCADIKRSQDKPDQCPENVGYTDVDDLAFEVLLIHPTTAPTKESRMPSSGGRQKSIFWFTTSALWMTLRFEAPCQ